jgi:RNA polymerase primary sigma factor
MRNKDKEARERESDEEEMGAEDETDTLGRYLREIGRYALLSAEQEKDLARRGAQGDQAAITRLVEANLRLVVRVAKRYANGSTELLDLIQEGNLGLIRAASRFDPERGCRFSTYATWWIHRAVQLSALQSLTSLHFPVHTLELVHKIRRVMSQLTLALGRDPSSQEIAEALNIAPERVVELRNMAERPVSLDAPLEEDESLLLADTLEDQACYGGGESPAGYATLYEALAALETEDRQVIEQFFGLNESPMEKQEQARTRVILQKLRVMMNVEEAMTCYLQKEI